MIQVESTSIQGQGQRANQEDTHYPASGSPTEGIFIVCDGVGGAEKGEVASRLAAESIGKFFESHSGKRVDKALVQKAVAESEQAIQSYLQDSPEAEGMGTTLAMLHVGDDKLTAAHIGDSRIYHFREGRILWQSKDHSWVNEMLERGLLTEEEARDHPRQNVITRALQGDLKKAVQADVHEIREVQQGDLLLLCSDGVPESFTNDDLAEMMMKNTGLPEKANDIGQACSEHSQDNYTAWILQITNDSTPEIPEIYEAEIVERPAPLAEKVKKKVKKYVSNLYEQFKK